MAVQIVVFGDWEMMNGYWVASYWGGAVAATGGALVIGALGRLQRRLSTYDAVLFALGVAILANSRPYEGLLLTVAAAVILAVRMLRCRVRLRVALQKFVFPVAVIMTITGGAMSYYCWRTTGNPLRLPYQENLRQYIPRRMFIWGETQSKVYRHEALARVYKFLMREGFSFKRKTYDAAKRILFFYLGPVLATSLLMMFRVVRDRRIWPVLMCCVVVALGVLCVEWVHIHYVAPLTGAFIIVVMYCLRHMVAFRPRSLTIGRITAVLLLSTSFIVTAADAWASRGWHSAGWALERERIQDQLIRQGGKHLVLVRYSPKHEPWREWVYNAADIDAAPVVWAREMPDNSALLRYFADRQIWLLEVDLAPQTIQRYQARETTDQKDRSLRAAE
jgi:hypothetical protein